MDEETETQGLLVTEAGIIVPFFFFFFPQGSILPKGKTNIWDISLQTKPLQTLVLHSTALIIKSTDKAG